MMMMIIIIIIIIIIKIKRLEERKLQWKTDGAGVPGEILDDFLHHVKVCKYKIDAFVGRDDLRAEGIQRLYEPNQSIDSASADTDSLRSISFCIIGKSGSGKTSLIQALP